MLFLCSFGHAQTIDSNYSFSWSKNKTLKYSDYKIKYELDTNGYLASYLDKDGLVRDTVVHNFYMRFDDTSMSYYGIDDTLAHSHVAIYPIYEIYEDTSALYYDINAIFYPYKSYMKVRTKDILEHEQIHFDIAEVHARILRKYFNDNIKKANLKKINKTIDDYYNRQVKVHSSYDLDAKINFIQAGNLWQTDSIWRKKIDIQLDSLKAYESPTGTVILK